MTIQQLREVHQTRPFQPFTLQLADGKEVEVKHPEFLAYSGRGRTIAVASPGGVIKIIDIMLIASIEIRNSKPRRSR